MGLGVDTAKPLADESMIMSMSATIRRFGRRSLRTVSAAMLATFLMLTVVAASPGLHRLIHADAHGSDHHCAVSMMTQGQIDLPACDNFLFTLPGNVDFTPRIEISVTSAAIEFLPLGRAPPIAFI
jgi:hypothetical protein